MFLLQSEDGIERALLPAALDFLAVFFDVFLDQ
jgi:hypothetical protein